jgi:hypothetical protein
MATPREPHIGHLRALSKRDGGKFPAGVHTHFRTGLSPKGGFLGLLGSSGRRPDSLGKADPHGWRAVPKNGKPPGVNPAAPMRRRSCRGAGGTTTAL